MRLLEILSSTMMSMLFSLCRSCIRCCGVSSSTYEGMSDMMTSLSCCMEYPTLSTKPYGSKLDLALVNTWFISLSQLYARSIPARFVVTVCG